MNAEFKNVLKLVKILYITEKGAEADYHVMPFQLVCEHVHITSCDNGWNDYLKYRPDIVILHAVSNRCMIDEMMDRIHKFDPRISFLLLTTKKIEQSLLISPLSEAFRVLVLPITFEQMTVALQEILESRPIKYQLHENLVYDPFNSLLIHDNTSVLLTPTENRLLEYLIEKSHRIVTYEEIANFVWNENEIDRNTLTSVISNLRKKIGNSHTLKNYSSQGYKIIPR